MKKENIFLIFDNGDSYHMNRTTPLDNVYGLVKTDKNEIEIQDLIDDYKRSDEYYNIDELQDYLENRGVNFIKFDVVYF